MKLTPILILAGALALIGAILFFSKTAEAPAAYARDVLAQCLRDKGAVMYGADWCTHCQNEKKAFGESFRFIPYVECPADPKQCIDLGIKGYPTWIFTDGTRLEGEQGLRTLSEKSGCMLP